MPFGATRSHFAGRSRRCAGVWRRQSLTASLRGSRRCAGVRPVSAFRAVWTEELLRAATLEKRTIMVYR